MNLMKRAAGMARGASTAPARKGEDESLVLFGELYRHDQEKDVDLLEPMFSVEFEAIQGDRRMYKLASGKRDYLLTDGEKHDYDWLKTPPATPLFASLEMEADSCQMVFQRELPILQPVKTSRFSGKPEAPSSSTSTKSESPTTSGSSKTATPTARPISSSKKNLKFSGKPEAPSSSTSTKSESPTTSSSSKSATPTARPNSSSKKNLTTRAPPAFSKDEISAYKIDKKSSYTPLGNRQHTPVVVPATDPKAAKKTSSGKKPTAPGSTNAAKNIADKPVLKNTAAAAPRARTKDPSIRAKDLKVDAGNGGATRRVSRQPAAATGTGKDHLVPVAARGRSRGGGEPATSNSVRVAEAVAGKDRRRAGGGDKEQQRQQKVGSYAKKVVG
ncbi:unnamed protein product [Alopecurus aequalis]